MHLLLRAPAEVHRKPSTSGRWRLPPPCCWPQPADFSAQAVLRPLRGQRLDHRLVRRFQRCRRHPAGPGLADRYRHLLPRRTARLGYLGGADLHRFDRQPVPGRQRKPEHQAVAGFVRQMDLGTHRDQALQLQAGCGGVLAIESRIQMPNVTGDKALGYWPAFWALGSPYRGNWWNWPGIGELDIMENVNGMNRVWGCCTAASTRVDRATRAPASRRSGSARERPASRRSTPTASNGTGR